jgi:hypothetical protein
VWLRWVHQQVRTAVAYELAASDPRRGPHLRRLPLVVDPGCGEASAYVRTLISRHTSGCVGHVDGDRVDVIADAVLADPGIRIAAPDFETLLAWRLAQYDTHPAGEERDGQWDGHECLDPELVAADLVRSGLIAPAWELAALAAERDELITRRVQDRRRPGHIRRRPAAPPSSQLALPL